MHTFGKSSGRDKTPGGMSEFHQQASIRRGNQFVGISGHTRPLQQTKKQSQGVYFIDYILRFMAKLMIRS